MDQVKTFRSIVRATLADLVTSHYAQMGSLLATQVSDEENGHYMIFLEGWQKMRHLYGTSIHVQVRDDGKVWIYRDSSSVIIIDQLEKAGIPTSQMVVTWHPPVARKHTEFAEG